MVDFHGRTGSFREGSDWLQVTFMFDFFLWIWFGWFGIGVPQSTSPFHKGIPGIQTQTISVPRCAECMDYLHTHER